MSECWNCKHYNENGFPTCNHCRVISEIVEIDYFTMLGLKKSFSQNNDEIEENYLSLQMKTHPDLYCEKSEKEQNLALQHNMALNDAYETLLNPVKKAEYLLKLNGYSINEEHFNLQNLTIIKPTSEILMEQMEKREMLENEQNFQDIEQKTLNEIKNVTQKLEMLNHFTNEAGALTIKLKYETKFLKEIRKIKRKNK